MIIREDGRTEPRRSTDGERAAFTIGLAIGLTLSWAVLVGMSVLVWLR